MWKEAQSVQHIVLDKSLSDILNSLHNCEREFHNYQMSQEEHISKISYLHSVIDKQSSVTKEQENKIQRLNDSVQKGETDTKKINANLSNCKRIINECLEEVELCKTEITKTELMNKGIQEKVIHEEKRFYDLIRELVSKNDIQFKVINEHLMKHDEQLTTLNEGLTTHIATCMKEIGDIKKNKHDTHNLQGQSISINQTI